MKRCILLMPSRADDAWISAIEEGLRPHDLVLVVLRDAADGIGSGDDDRQVFLAFHSSVLDGLGEADRVVLACDAVHYREVADKPLVEEMRDLTARHVEALAWPSRLYVSDAQIEAATNVDGEVEIFPGVKIRPPAGRTADADTTASDVSSMFRRGAPEAGRLISWSSAYLTAVSFKGSPVDAAAVLEMAGPPRPLVKGPYFTLPPGVWRVVVEFSLDELGTRNELRIEWGPPEKFVSIRSRPMRAGLYRASLVQEWREASYAELIIELMNGCIGGGLRVISMNVELLSSQISERAA